MVATKYTYSIATDTANGLYGGEELTKEITDSAIAQTLSHINTNDDALEIWFDNGLSAGDQTALTGIVNAHAGPVSVASTITPTTVIVQEHDSSVSGSYVLEGYTFNAPANQVTTYDFSLPFPVAILAGDLSTKGLNDGDSVDFQVAPDTTIGVVAVAAAINDTEVQVAQSVIDNIKVGRYVTFGANTEEYAVTAVDDDTNKITVSPALVNAHAVNDLVKMSIYMVKNLQVVDTGIFLSFGESKIGASAVGANTTLRCRYNNAHPSNAVSVKFFMELLY